VKPLHIALLAAWTAVFVWSGIQPHDYYTWVLEVAPAVIGVIIILAIYKHYKFTDLVYVLMFTHMIILMIGGHYTYAEVPLFNWLRDEYGLSRNHYDRVGHFFQGFVPAMIAREVMIRRDVLARTGWMFFLVCSIALSVSAVYELVEWFAAILSSTGAESFLALQGDIWDTQKDMALALTGAITAQLLLARWHDAALARRTGRSGAWAAARA
jgi:putative membrane protein